MAKWRKKPVVVEAEVYIPGMEDGFDNNCNWGCANIPKVCMDCSCHNVPYIRTLEGKHFISTGDYIITGVKGERYPCKPDIFHMTYETV
jgi:hypothetical protein